MRATVGALWAMGALSSLYWLANLYATIRSGRALVRLADLPIPTVERWPTVSLIVAACNEARTLKAALESKLADDYPALEVIVVNDRSTDETGAIADATAARDARVKVVHVTTLPEGWLGKLHAMHVGVERATGEWLLFSDADVHLAPGTLRRAIGRCLQGGFDHLSLVPSVWAQGLALDAAYSVFMRNLMVAGMIWKVEDPRSKAAVGGGLFNLVRRSAYDKTEGFTWLKLEIADDVMLARMLKQSGARSTVVNGVRAVGLDFYADLADMAKGMEKGAFAIVGGYRLSQLVAMVAAFTVNECGWIAALAQPYGPWLRALGALTLAVVAMTEWRVTRLVERRLLASAIYPVGVALLGFFFVRSGVLGVLRGGVVWRGTLYPTPMLRAGRRIRLLS